MTGCRKLPLVPLFTFKLLLARALYEQRVCFPPSACILLSFKSAEIEGWEESSLRDRIKGGGNFSTLKTRLQSPGNQQIKFQSLTRSCKKYREEEEEE